MSIEKFIVKFAETELLNLDAKWGVQYPLSSSSAGQLEKAYGILPIYGWHQKTYLYHQYFGRVSSSDSQGNKKQGRVPFGYSP